MRSMSLPTLLLLGALALPDGLGAEPVTYTIDPAKSRMEVIVGRSGFLAKLSHRIHVGVGAFQGRVVADRERLREASLELDVDATSLKILGCDLDHDDLREAQRYMAGKRCLDVRGFPAITFRSNRVRVSPRPKDGAYLLVNGYLDIHGSPREFEVPVTVHFTEDRLEATGSTTLRQSDHQIHPWKDLLGLIEVPDAVTVEFRIIARK